MNWLRRLFGNPYAGMSAKEIYAIAKSAPGNPYGAISETPEYKEYIARQLARCLAEGRTPPEPPSDDPTQWWPKPKQTHSNGG